MLTHTFYRAFEAYSIAPVVIALFAVAIRSIVIAIRQRA